MKLSLQHILLMILLLSTTLGCEKDNEGIDEEPEAEGTQIRPILNQQFILTDYPLALLDRSTCAFLDTFRTNGEGVFFLEEYDRKDFIILAPAQDSGQFFIGIVIGESIDDDIINDVFITESATAMIVTGPGLDTELTRSTKEDFTVQYQVWADARPLGKFSIQVAEGSNVLTSAPINSEGIANITLPNQKAGIHYLKLQVTGIAGEIIYETNVEYRVVEAFDANLRYRVDECKTIHLSWDEYDLGDFVRYEVRFTDDNRESPVCEDFGHTNTIYAKENTMLYNADYAHSPEVCIQISIQSKYGTYLSDSISLINPYRFISKDLFDPENPTQMSDGTIYYESFNGLGEGTLCKVDGAVEDISCNPMQLKKDQLLFRGQVNGAYLYGGKNSGNLEIYDENNQIQYKIENIEPISNLHITRDGWGLTQDEDYQIRLINFETGTIGRTFPFDRNDIIANIHGFNQFGIVTHYTDSNFFPFSRFESYNIINEDSIAVSSTLELGNSVHYDEFKMSPNGRFMAFQGGQIFDLGNPESAVVRVDIPLEYSFATYFISDKLVAYNGAADGEMVIYDLNSGESLFQKGCGRNRFEIGIRDTGKMLFWKRNVVGPPNISIDELY